MFFRTLVIYLLYHPQPYTNKELKQRVMIMMVSIITLCAYAQQGLVVWSFVYILYITTKTKNRLFSALLLENLLLYVIYCLLFKFKRLHCGLVRPGCSGTVCVLERVFQNDSQSFSFCQCYDSYTLLFIHVAMQRMEFWAQPP